MAKKIDEKSSTKNDKDLERKKAAEEEELDEEEDEEEDEEDEDEEDEAAVPAKADDRRHRAHAPADDDDDDDDAEAPAEEDPTWWAPHAVLGVLVVVGILGFFGVFNKVLGFLAATPAGVASETTTAQPASKPATQPDQPSRMQQPQPGQQPQPPREMFGAKHLLVMYKGGRRAPPNVERTKEEAKARAEEAAKKAKDPKNKFEDLVKEYSDEPGAGARGGDLGKFPKGAMVPEFQNALEKLKVNEVSGIVESPFGFHVILRTQ